MKHEVIILAAGKGKRMLREDLPKVLVSLHGRPLIDYVIQSVTASGVTQKPIVVVGFKSELVMQHLGGAVQYAHQIEQLGTGHAVAVALPVLEPETEHVVVLNGDMPLVHAESIAGLVAQHTASGAVLTMGTVTVADFNDWRAGFYDFGRIVRNTDGAVAAIIEKRDATPQQLAITEVNPSHFCFSVSWLRQALSRLHNDNTQGEYYLTDVVALAMADRLPIATVPVAAFEALGVNTPEQLALVADVAVREARVVVG